jgi:hypothetical protein
MFSTISRLQFGDETQRRAFDTIIRLGILTHLGSYNPVLCGTLPLGIHVADSDLDLILEVYDFQEFERTVITLYGNFEGFRLKQKIIQGMETIKANFSFGGFEFELFGQPQPVKRQRAYQHMIVEEYLLRKDPSLRKQVIELKKSGVKTEPAFAQILGMKGDPYDELLRYGKNVGIL